MIVLEEYEFEKNMREDILKYGSHDSNKACSRVLDSDPSNIEVH